MPDLKVQMYNRKIAGLIPPPKTMLVSGFPSTVCVPTAPLAAATAG